MKSLLFISLSLIFSLILSSGFAQNVTITPDGITPATSNMYPRLSHEALMALPSPQSGDIAYDVTFRCLRLYNGTKWVRLMTDVELNSPSMTAWAVGGVGSESSRSIAVDTLGNVYIAGYISGTTVFGNDTIVSAGLADVFVAKYTKEGILQWLKHGGGSAYDYANNVKVDRSGNVYITGVFEGTANFDSLSVTATGAMDIFIIKYNSGGQLQWLKQGNAANYGYGFALAIDINDDLYVTGSFGLSADFGKGAITSAGSHDVFIAKYDGTGDLKWVQKGGGALNDIAYGIAVDSAGFVFITGYFQSSASFGTINVTSAGNGDIFIAKYDPFLLKWDWVVSNGSAGHEIGIDLAVDKNGNVYVTGIFDTTINFSGTTLSNKGGNDFFVAKYDSLGTLLWVRSTGDIGEDQSCGLIVDASGNVYVTGFFNSVASFDHLSLISVGMRDTFIAKYSTSGTVQWVQRAGSIDNDEGKDVAIDANKNIYITGYFTGTNLFGSTPVTSAGSGDIFVARIKE